MCIRVTSAPSHRIWIFLKRETQNITFIDESPAPTTQSDFFFTRMLSTTLDPSGVYMHIITLSKNHITAFSWFNSQLSATKGNSVSSAWHRRGWTQQPSVDAVNILNAFSTRQAESYRYRFSLGFMWNTLWITFDFAEFEIRINPNQCFLCGFPKWGQPRLFSISGRIFEKFPASLPKRLCMFQSFHWVYIVVYVHDLGLVCIWLYIATRITRQIRTYPQEPTGTVQTVYMFCRSLRARCWTNFLQTRASKISGAWLLHKSLKKYIF